MSTSYRPAPAECYLRKASEELARSGVPLPVVTLAIHGVGVGEFATQVVELSSALAFQFVPAGKELNLWMSYWRTPSSLLVDLYDAVWGVGTPEELKGLRDDLDTWSEKSVEERRLSLVELGDDFLRTALREGAPWISTQYESALAQAYHSTDPALEFTSKNLTPIMFMLGIWLRSWIVLDKDCSEVYGAAVRGEAQALREINELDRWARLMPEIAKHFNEGFLDSSAKTQDWGTDVLNQTSRSRTVSWLKSLMASWLVDFSTGLAKTIGCGAIHYGDVWRLYQAQAKDHGQAQDFDLPEKLELFGKEVSRRRKEFPLEALDKIAQQAV